MNCWTKKAKYEIRTHKTISHLYTFFLYTLHVYLCTFNIIMIIVRLIYFLKKNKFHILSNNDLFHSPIELTNSTRNALNVLSFPLQSFSMKLVSSGRLNIRNLLVISLKYQVGQIEIAAIFINNNSIIVKNSDATNSSFISNAFSLFFCSNIREDSTRNLSL